MASVNINGKTYVGNVISVRNGQVFIDGQLQIDNAATNKLSISIEGKLEKLEADGDVEVIKTGTAESKKKMRVVSAGSHFSLLSA